MIRRFLAALTLLLLAPALCPAAQPPELNADQLDTDMQSGEQIFTGRASLNYDGALLTADQIRVNLAQQTATARGHVVLTQGARRFLADEIIYHYGTKNFSVVRLRLGDHPLFVSGDSVTGTPEKITVTRATASYYEPGHFAPTLTAATLDYFPNDKIRATRGRLGLGAHVPLLPFTQFEQSVREPLLSNMSARFGQRSHLGFFADLGLHAPVAPGVKAGGDLGYFTKRGVLLGPSGTFNTADGDRRSVGALKTGYIRDTGERGSDVLGEPVRADRHFITWWSRHRDDAHRTTVTTQLGRWSDSAVVRDFRPGDFYSVQQPDTFLEAAAERDNAVVSLFLRAAPNSFQNVQRRLPELRVDFLPAPVGAGFVQRLNTSAVSLREHTFTVATAPDTLPVYTDGPTVKSNRLDAFYSLTRPINPAAWLNFTPVAGARVTHYADATGGKDDYTRVLGELGLDASLRASGIYEYRNPRWDIDGIRHLVTPKLSYRYIPSADKGRAYIPAVDDRVFDTALQPLELGDRRDIDELRATNTLRLGLDNTFQTRDKTYGSRDLLVLNLAEDLRFHREPGEKQFAEIHTGLSFMPVRWMQFDLYNSFTPRDLASRELNTRFSIRDGTVWSLGLASHYLRGQIEEYVGEGRRRLNENFETVVRLQFDARRSRFNERSLAIRQTVAKLWAIEYGVSWYEGRQRESDFGFRIDIRLAGF